MKNVIRLILLIMVCINTYPQKITYNILYDFKLVVIESVACKFLLFRFYFAYEIMAIQRKSVYLLRKMKKNPAI